MVFRRARLSRGVPETHETALKRIKVVYEMSHLALGPCSTPGPTPGPTRAGPHMGLGPVTGHEGPRGLEARGLGVWKRGTEGAGNEGLGVWKRGPRGLETKVRDSPPGAGYPM